MRFRRRRPVVRNKKRKKYLIVLLLLLVILFVYALFNIKLVPVLKTTAEYRAKTVAMSTINNAVGKVLKKDDISYEKLMSFEKNSEGDITAVKADTLQMNLLKYDITNEIVKELSNVDSSDLNIPLGSIVGGQLFTGRGPRIQIRFYPVGNINSDITNTFTAAGINQTRQQIMLNVKTDITVMMSAYIVNSHLESSYCIAESVIVGKVPNSYTVVDGDNSASSKIFTYDPNQK